MVDFCWNSAWFLKSVSGFTLKLWNLFLKIHKWILVEMSLNCKHSSSNGKLSSSLKRKKAWVSLHKTADGRKWKRVVVFLWLVVVLCWLFWVLNSSNGGYSEQKVETPVSSEFKVQVLLEYCNTSKEELHALDSLLTERDRVRCHCFSNQSIGLNDYGFSLLLLLI